MRPTLLLAIIVLCLFSCKKDEPVSPALVGSWELRSSFGPAAGMGSTYKAGNGNILQLKSDSTFKQMDKNKLILQGTFHIRTSYSSSGNPAESIRFSNNPDNSWEQITLNGASLTLSVGLIPEAGSTYEKIGN